MEPMGIDDSFFKIEKDTNTNISLGAMWLDKFTFE